MTTSGWILMIASWMTIIGLFAFCLYRVFTDHRKPEN